MQTGRCAKYLCKQQHLNFPNSSKPEDERMSVKNSLLISSIGILLLAGCSTTVNMYPVKGPLSEQKPLPVLVATVDGIMGNTGGFNLTLPSGATCSGRWSSIAPMSVGHSSIGLAGAWGFVYGSGYSVRNLPGINRGEAMATCTDHTTIQVEFFTGSGTANGNGVAQDSAGNTYKLIF